MKLSVLKAKGKGKKKKEERKITLKSVKGGKWKGNLLSFLDN